MSTGTGIEWTEATWNPVSGCTRASPGCDHCYAVPMSYRLEAMGQAKYHGLTVLNGKGERHFNGVVRTHDATLTVPLGWRKPRKVFVNSTSDLFHKGVPFDFIDKVFAVMALCPQHTFQILTKRPERMAEYMASRGADGAWAAIPRQMQTIGGDEHDGWRGGMSWPLPNVWLGTSVENRAALERIMKLAQCPAAMHFVSFEPLLEDLGNIRGYLEQHVEWGIVGCESRGNFAGRFADGYETAAQSILDQCADVGVAAFHKQTVIGKRVSGDPSEWPVALRVRQMPEGK